MANPSPQHNPTDGLGTATELTLTASTEALTTIVAAHEYSVTLSLSSTGHANATTLTAAIKDVAGSVFSSGNSNVVKFRVLATGPTTESVNSPYTAKIASVGATTGVITALAVGQTVVEAYFPTFDEGTSNSVGLNDVVFAQVIVNVVV